MQNQWNELITNGSSSRTEISPRSRTTITKEWSRIEPWMSPRDGDSFPSCKFSDLYSLISEPEAEIGEIQYGQLGESTTWDNHWAKNWWPGHHIQQGRAPLQEEKGLLEPKLSHPRHQKDRNRVCIFRWSASKGKG
ncbi:uncharacterized protein J3R85_006519 [Psidium guajava]|nr:uncharacterized protein J3R85_006519 [Psidium guajava]